MQDPTSIESDPLRDGGAVAARPGGLGRGDVVANARFTAGATVRASLPLALGGDRPSSTRAKASRSPTSRSRTPATRRAAAKAVLVAPRLDAFRLPALVLVDARLSREVRVARGTASPPSSMPSTLLNTAATLQVARDVELPALDRPREIVRPRLIRGARRPF